MADSLEEPPPLPVKSVSDDRQLNDDKDTAGEYSTTNLDDSQRLTAVLDQSGDLETDHGVSEFPQQQEISNSENFKKIAGNSDELKREIEILPEKFTVEPESTAAAAEEDIGIGEADISSGTIVSKDEENVIDSEVEKIPSTTHKISAESENAISEVKNEEKLTDDDDEFGDFEEFGDFSAVTTTTSNDFDNNTGNREHNLAAEEENGSGGDGGTGESKFVASNWAAFEDTGAVAAGGPDDDEWKADFGSASEVPATEAVCPVQEPRRDELILQEDLPSLEALIADSPSWTANGSSSSEFQGESSTEESRISNLFTDIFASCDKPNTGTTGDVFRDPLSFWRGMRVVEETNALKMRFNSSTVYLLFLHSLAMDPNLAKLRVSNLPVFAQHLGGGAILTPMASAGGPSNEDLGSTIAASNFASTPTTTTSLPSASSVEIPKISNAKKSNSEAIDSLSVPPAQFDWKNSGLTNPLTAASVNASSAILDLDFLTANESKGGNISMALQKDLASLGLDGSAKTDDDVPQNSQDSKQTSLLDELMKTGMEKRTKLVPVSELSVEAKALHDALPNLDYMRSSVLMFPVRSHNNDD